MDDNTLIILLLCIFISPLGVWWKTRQCDINTIICLILWLLFCIPGMIYALWFCFFKDQNTNQK